MNFFFDDLCPFPKKQNHFDVSRKNARERLILIFRREQYLFKELTCFFSEFVEPILQKTSNEFCVDFWSFGELMKFVRKYAFCLAKLSNFCLNILFWFQEIAFKKTDRRVEIIQASNPIKLPFLKNRWRCPTSGNHISRFT